MALTQDQMNELLRNRGGDALIFSHIAQTKPIPNPAYEQMDVIDRKLHEKMGTLPPKTIDVPIQRWESRERLIEAYQDPSTGDWQVIEDREKLPTSSTAKPTPQQDALKEEQARQLQRERDWNLNNGPTTIDPVTGLPGRGSGLAESHAERVDRETKEAAELRAREDQAAQARRENREIEAARQAELNREEEARIARERLDIERANQQRLAEAEARQTKTAEEAAALAREEFNARREKEAADALRLDRPKPIGTPSDTERSVAIFDPVTGQLSAQPNPMFDEAKANAARLKDQLSVGIALNQITAQQAAQQYKQFWDTQVELPFRQMAEQRARAAEQRAALEAEDRRRQFAADFGLRKATLGQQAGQAAVQTELALLPYRGGPQLASQMSSAINSLAAGGKIEGPDASAGINFTPEAFQFDRPDFEGIARKATANALKGLTNYKPSGTFSTANYEGISMPTGAGAPSPSAGIDMSGLWEQYQNIGIPSYTGPPPE